MKFAPVHYGEEGEEEAWHEVELCTGPAHPATHWKQTVLVLPGNLGSSPVEEDEVLTFLHLVLQFWHNCVVLYR